MPELFCRPGIERDGPELFRLLKRYFEEVPLVPADDPAMLVYIRHVLRKGVVYVLELEDGLVGSVGLMPASWWSSTRQYLTAGGGQGWFYVAPEGRKRRGAVPLIKAAKAFAEQADLPLVLEIHSYGAMARKNKVFRRHFTSVGEVFVTGMERGE